MVNVSGATYRPKVDTGSFRTYTFANNVWTVTDKDGKVYTFGSTASARQDNPSDTSKIYAWYLETIRDPNDNDIKYTYYKEAGQIYPSTIVYTGNGTTDGNLSVVVNREARSDDLTLYTTGFGVTTKYRINSIQAKVNAQVVREYTLGYTTGTNGIRSLLASVTEKSYDDNNNLVTLPPTQFTYQAATKSWSGSSAWNMPELFTDGLGRDQGTRLGDVNGDGLPDVIRTVNSLYNNDPDIYKFYLNSGQGWQLSSWSIPSTAYFYDAGSVPGSLGDGGTRLFDPNGDGIGDLIVASGAGHGGAYLGNGTTGWTLNSTWSSPTSFSDSCQLLDYGTRLGDVNGDSLDDVVVSRISACYGVHDQEHRTIFNSGNGWRNAPTTWQAPELFGPYEGDHGTRMVDVNGDGLVDILRANKIDLSSTTNRVYINNGSSWVYDSSWSVPRFIIDRGNNMGIEFVDVNSDGLTDMVQGVYSSDPSDHRIYINTGKGWQLDTAWSGIGDIYAFGDTGVRFADVNGDNLVDWVKAGRDYGGGTSIGTSLHDGKVPDLLTHITTAQGGTADITYKPSTLYSDGTGVRSNTKIPFAIDTVASVTQGDGLGGSATTAYTYGGGQYYYANALDRKFSGFATTTLTDAVGNVTKTYFHQGNGSQSALGEYSDDISKAGKPYRIEKYDSQGHLYELVVNQWDPEFLQNMRKAKGYTQFACYVRNHTRRPIALTVPLGQMERQEKLTSAQLEQVLAENRRRYGATGSGVTLPRMSEGESLSRPDLL